MQEVTTTTTPVTSKWQEPRYNDPRHWLKWRSTSLKWFHERIFFPFKVSEAFQKPTNQPTRTQHSSFWRRVFLLNEVSLFLNQKWNEVSCPKRIIRIEFVQRIFPFFERSGLDKVPCEFLWQSFRAKVNVFSWYTPPKFHIAPEKGWLEDYFRFGMAFFCGLS